MYYNNYVMTIFFIIQNYIIWIIKVSLHYIHYILLIRIINYDNNFIIFFSLIGNKLASKIKLKINKISKQIEAKILYYQNLRSKSKLMADEFPEATFGDIINHNSNFWKSLDLTTDDDFNIPRIVISNELKKK